MARAVKLNKFLDTVLQGKTVISQTSSSRQLIEAICAQTNPTACIDKIIAASEHGLSSVAAALRTDLSPAFFNGPAADLLRYLQDPAIKAISGGKYLDMTLKAIVEPPIFWSPFLAAFKDSKLKDEAQQCFAWLLLQLVLFSNDPSSLYISTALDVEQALCASHLLPVRDVGDKIKNTVTLLSAPPMAATKEEHPPGGRHDNDFADFRLISILPTGAELASGSPPFLRTSYALDDPDTEAFREAIYLDNTYRLMREEMLNEMRDELQVALGKQPGKKHRGFAVKGLRMVDVNCGEQNRRSKWGVVFECLEDFPELAKLTKLEDRRAFFKKKENFKLLKNGSLCCLLVDDEVIAFPVIRRNEDLLAKNPPQIVLEVEGDATVKLLLLKAKTALPTRILLIQIDTALFSFEPILSTLKRMKSLPLAEEVLFWNSEKLLKGPQHPAALQAAVASFKRDPNLDIGRLLKLNKRIILDAAQARSLSSALEQNLSIIQGPPGTGKSFIGALLAKFIYEFSDQTILVVCYTNHALDQFLEDLLGVGIPEGDMVRLGGKSTAKTEGMLLQNQPRRHAFSRGDQSIINQLKRDGESRAITFENAFRMFLQSSVRHEELMVHLEFGERDFFDAFEVPVSDDGMVKVGKQGRAVDEFYLINRWRGGQNAGQFANEPNVKAAARIWRMKLADRKALEARWSQEIMMEAIDGLYGQAQRYNTTQTELMQKFGERNIMVLKSKRIVACTTTAAAKYGSDIQEASPDITLVEEAGEILESHVITALGPATKQLVLIGDHKQLRPKVNNYDLTVEKGDGYDLNRSLFERLVLKGYPHHTLIAQHRMRPEISALIRHLTYPDLVDAEKTKNRPDLDGLQDNIIFIDHSRPEDNNGAIADRRDLGSKSSKQNSFEARMVLKIVKYLAQQGYNTADLVVLTPYLGQLSKLQQDLREEIDPVLNDLDSFELVRAGLITSSSASKSRLRLATIDNYQGEESDIVVVSLTRSNSNNDIGFMFAPERLNVLLSRARNGLIMIGNSHTFSHARKGSDLWKSLFDMLRHNNHFYKGLPVMCQRHPDRKSIIMTDDQFDVVCPEGGCSEPCGVKLSCGVHVCPLKCHQLTDHSSMPCLVIIPDKCNVGHDMSKRCSDPPFLTCKECDRKAKLARAKQEKEFQRRVKREAEEAAHLERVKKLNEELAEQQEILSDAQRRGQQKNEILQKMEDLQRAKDTAQRAGSTKIPPSTKGSSHTMPDQSNTRGPSPSGHSPPSSASSPGNVTSPSSPPGSSESSPSITHPSVASTTKPGGAPPNPRSRGPFILTAPPTTADLSEAEADWEYRKRVSGVVNPPLDQIMGMIGLESVKKSLLEILDKVDLFKRQNASLADERFHVTFQGNPGTGKTTVARHYAKFLCLVGVLAGSAFEEVTGASLVHDGVTGAKSTIAKIVNAGGGVIFIDEAYQLTSSGGRHSKTTGSSPVLDYLLAEIENNRGKIVFIFAGYNKQMETFFEHNPGIPSRVPNTLQFEDYTNAELLRILEYRIHGKFNGKMKVEDGVKGLFGRIVAIRLGRGRGREGFGNARALENILSQICSRQAARISKERRAGGRPDDFALLGEDVIGPEPTDALQTSDAWAELQKLIGLATVKESVRILFDKIQINYKRELAERPIIEMSLNRVFFGSPGTGKTSVARLYGKILADLGLLSNGEVILKNPSDFIGQYIGESEAKTKAILETSKGKVLIIDEAYGLSYDGSKSSHADTFKKDVIETLVAEVQGGPSEDRCVLLLGYKEQMLEMFQNVNEGLKRRFALDDAFEFADFSSLELLEILNLKMNKDGLAASAEGLKVALARLERSKLRPGFGNGGEVDNLLSSAKGNYIKRMRGKPPSVDIILEPQDFDPDYDRANNASENLKEMFKDVVGCDAVVQKLRSYQEVARIRRARGEDVNNLIPTNFVFKGPPGTGKTTTARKMGKVYYDMGFLAKPDVTECSTSDLVGQYVGHTGPKTRKIFEKALGQVLFIDEAYRLSRGQFAQEAVDEMVDLLTQDKYKGKIVVILAGYEKDINNLLSVNSGLTSRFPEEIVFQNLPMPQCMQILATELKKQSVVLAGIEVTSSPLYIDLAHVMMDLSSLQGWGNARDVIQLAKKMASIAVVKSPDLILDPKDAMDAAIQMYKDRFSRTSNMNPPSRRQRSYSGPTAPPPDASTPSAGPNTASGSNSASPPSNTSTPSFPSPTPSSPTSTEGAHSGRDAGVSDDVWEQLQRDREKAVADANAIDDEIKAAQEQRRDAEAKEAKERAAIKRHALAEARATDVVKKDKIRRQREQAVIREAQAKKEKERQDQILKERKDRQDKARRDAARVQQRLKLIGKCVQGYVWIKQHGGYRCAGGYHFVTDAEIGFTV